MSSAIPDEKKEAPPKPVEIPKPDEAAVKRARAALVDEDRTKLQERFAAVDVAERTGDKALIDDLFTAAITAIDPAFAVYAGEAANRIDAVEATRVYDARYRKLKQLRAAQAVRFLGEVRTKRAIARLVEVAGGKSGEARVEALYGLVKQGDPTTHPHLAAALKTKDYAVRAPAAICCGLARVEAAAPLLLRGLEDPKSDYAFFCAWALGQLRDPELLAKVVAATKAKMGGDVGTAKAKAILECSFDAEAHTDILIRLTKSSHESLAGAAAWGLGKIAKGNAEAESALLALMNRVRGTPTSHQAIDALGRIGTPELGKRILAKYEGNPGKVSQPVVKALGLLKTPEAASFLLNVALTNKKLAIRKQAAIAYWQCAGRGARAEFQKRLSEETHARKVQAGCLVLGFDRSADGFLFATELLYKHYGKKAARYARDALERMTGHRFMKSRSVWKEWFEKNPDFFDRKPQFLDRENWRRKLLESKAEMGISPKTEAAVERGLAWLSRHQSLDGRWVGDRFYTRCRLFYKKKCQIGARLGGWDVGMSGIALLAFYGAGYLPHKGRYKDTVLRGQVFVASRQWADGDFGGQEDLIGGYTRPIASIALSEAYGSTREEEYQERAWRSAAHIIRIQYADAGWRYRLGGQYPGDTSVTGWNAWAIATARKFGVPVDPMGLEGANSLIDLFSSVVTQDEEYYNHDPRYYFDVGRGQEFEHFTGYNAREETRPPMTAIGLICKIFMGRKRSHPYCIGAANRLLKSIPTYDERANEIKYATGAEYPSYYWYYGSLAMYQMGGRFWRNWSRPLLTKGIPNTQIQGDVCENGSWGCANLDSIGGRVYTTAMCVLTLETFYRYLPALTLE
jgi:HEAT repeat protein